MMSIDEQVALLMQGTEYGDEQMKQAMARELKERLIEAEKDGRPLKRLLRLRSHFERSAPGTYHPHAQAAPVSGTGPRGHVPHRQLHVAGRRSVRQGQSAPASRPPSRWRENGQTYAEQAFKMLDRAKTRVRYNAEWLSELIVCRSDPSWAQNFTVQQFLTARISRMRLERDDPVYLHETFYALMQGYDAVAQAHRRAGGRQRSAVQHHRGGPQDAGSGQGRNRRSAYPDGHSARHRWRGAHVQESGQSHPHSRRAGRHVRQDHEPARCRPCRIFFKLVTARRPRRSWRSRSGAGRRLACIRAM